MRKLKQNCFCSCGHWTHGWCHTVIMSACAEDAEKLEIAVTGGGEDSMQLNTATSGYLNGLSALRHLYEGLYKLDARGRM